MTGYLELIIGPMFSGKTSSLISLYKQYILYNKDVCIVNYALDKRYSEDKMTTHDKVGIDCIFVDSLEVLKDNTYDIILVNEGQFFDDLVSITKKWVELDGKRVHIGALDGDFMRRPFNNISKLIPLCDSLVKRKAICVECKDGTEALFSMRYNSEDTSIINIGGSETYKPVCRSCYTKQLSKQPKESFGL